MQRRRKRQLESGDIVMIREKEKLKRRRQRELKSGNMDDKKPRNLLGLFPKVPKERTSTHRDWSPFYKREGGIMRCLGCLAEFGGLSQGKIYLTDPV